MTAPAPRPTGGQQATVRRIPAPDAAARLARVAAIIERDREAQRAKEAA